MSNPYTLSTAPCAKPESIVSGNTYRFTVLTSRLIRMEYQEDGHFVDVPTQTVLCRDFPTVPFRVLEHESSLEIVTEHLHLYYDKRPFSREGLTVHLSEGFHVYGSSWSYGEPIPNLKGTYRTLDEANGAIELDDGLMSPDGYTVLDDSHAAQLGPDLWPMAKTIPSTDLYFFGYGHDYLQCLRDFYRLSGPTPLLPRFALGNWWSRFYRYTEDSYLELMNTFRSKGLPFSTAVIDMDWHLTEIPKKYGSGWTGYTWNPDYFPDPKRFMDKLHELGMHVTLNVHPADGVRAHEEAYLNMAKELGIDYENEDKIPFDAASRPFLEAYFKYLHHPHEAHGVDFWWLDWQQGTRGSAKGIDTLWLLNHLHFLDNGRTGKQPITFSRYAGIGSHRYPVGFSGDTYSTWESLDFQPYFTANASNVGYSWWSHDIGGHQKGRRDDELAVRWLQFGVFSPIMRLHSTYNEFYGKEPWKYGIQAEQIMTRFLQLRHQLIPYLYSMNYHTHLHGLPLMQPMYYLHDTWEAYTVPNQYYFGSEMIVCPITRPVDTYTQLGEFNAWLPKGDWFDFFTGQYYKGGRRLDLYRDLNTIPVLVKAGGIVPTAKDPMHSHEENPDILQVHVFYGADGQFDLYEDNNGQIPVITRFQFTSGAASSLSVSTIGTPQGILPEHRKYEILLHGISEPKHIYLLGHAEGSVEYRYNTDIKVCSLSLSENDYANFSIQITTKGDTPVAPDYQHRIYKLLQQAQIEYQIKSQIFDLVCAETEPARLLGELHRMRLSPALAGAVIEQLISEF